MVTPSICAKGENSSANVCDWICTCIIVVNGGGIEVVVPVCHTMLLGILPTPELMLRKIDVPI
jgi:hypothetical protein